MTTLSEIKLQKSIDWRNIEDAIFEWVSTITGINFIWGNQDVSMPPYPYAVCKIIAGPNRLNTRDAVEMSVDLSNVGNEVKLTYQDIREFVLNIQIRDEPNQEIPVSQLMNNLISSRQLDVVNNFFEQNCLALIETRNVLDISMPINNKYISIMSGDFTFNTDSKLEENTTFIETVNATYVDPNQ